MSQLGTAQKLTIAIPFVPHHKRRDECQLILHVKSVLHGFRIV
jgi:hypothetical protein